MVSAQSINADIVLYHSRYSRSFTAYWLLEELGRPFRVVDTDIRSGRQKSAEFLAINPAGKVPAVVVDGSVITERPAICLYLADRFAMGKLAPNIDDVRRAAYLKWMVWSTSVMEPVAILRQRNADQPAHHVGWGDFETMESVLADQLKDRVWLLGDEFTAADVMVGGNVCWMSFNGLLTKRDEFVTYADRLKARPGYRMAAEATWPGEG